MAIRLRHLTATCLGLIRRNAAGVVHGSAFTSRFCAGVQLTRPSRASSRPPSHRRVKQLWLSLMCAVFGVVACAAKEFTVLATGEADWEGVAYQATAAKVIPLSFSQQRRSAVVKALGETLVFTRERINEETGQPVQVPVARATWPADTRTALLIFVPKSVRDAEGLEFDVQVMDDGADGFPSDTLRVFNLTSVRLLGFVGKRQCEFDPGTSPAIPMKDVANQGAVAMPLALALRTEKDVQPLYLAPLEIRPNTRVLVVALPPRVKRSPKIRVLTISQPMPKPETQ